MKCRICPHACDLDDGQTGLCRARSNRGGTIVSDNYGQITAMALDPIEKKPLRRFFPGSNILSVGSFGCNLMCPFCQNHGISMADSERSRAAYVSPEELVDRALACVNEKNIGVAFTYNEPLIGYEYVRDCAAQLKKQNLKTVLVTNGYINAGPLLKLLPDIDAMNIDLKCFNEGFYKKIGGSLETVKGTIEAAAGFCHLEVTTLIIPGENDTPDEMRRLSSWLADIDAGIPLHVSRFFPRYQWADRNPTPTDTVYALSDIASERLLYVYAGNC